jgi:hypothetical protein
VKLDMANIDDLTDASVSAMQKLTSLVDLSLLYCLDYPLSGEALHELVQACPLLSALTLQRGASYSHAENREQNFQPSMLPGCSTLLAIRDLLEERGGAWTMERRRIRRALRKRNIPRASYPLFTPSRCIR